MYKSFLSVLGCVGLLIFVSVTHCFANIIVNNPSVIQQIIEVTDITNKNFLDICRVNGVCSKNLKIDTTRITFYLDTAEPDKVVFEVPIVDSNNDTVGVAKMPFGYNDSIKEHEVLDSFSLKNPNISLNLLHMKYEDEDRVYGTKNPIKYDVYKIKSMLKFGEFDFMYYSREYDDDDNFGDLILNHEIRPISQKTTRVDTYFVGIDEIVPLHQRFVKPQAVSKKTTPAFTHKQLKTTHPPHYDFSKHFLRKARIVRPIAKLQKRFYK